MIGRSIAAIVLIALSIGCANQQELEALAKRWASNMGYDDAVVQCVVGGACAVRTKHAPMPIPVDCTGGVGCRLVFAR